jgi:hypothetical protein
MSANSLIIGLTLRCFPKEGFPDYVILNFEEAMASLLRQIATEDRGHFLFFPFYDESAWPDTRALANVLRRIKVIDVPVEVCRWRDMTDLRQKISTCNAFVGTRLHSILLSVQAGVPVLSISYAEKAWRFMTENGLGRFVVRIEEASSDSLKERWNLIWHEREKIRKIFTAVTDKQKQLALRHFDLVLQAVKRQILK